MHRYFLPENPTEEELNQALINLANDIVERNCREAGMTVEQAQRGEYFTSCPVCGTRHWAEDYCPTCSKQDK